MTLNKLLAGCVFIAAAFGGGYYLATLHLQQDVVAYKAQLEGRLQFDSAYQAGKEIELYSNLHKAVLGQDARALDVLCKLITLKVEQMSASREDVWSKLLVGEGADNAHALMARSELQAISDREFDAALGYARSTGCVNSHESEAESAHD